MDERTDRLLAVLDELISERNEARKAARVFRDLYVSCVGRTYPEEYSLPWEGGNGDD